jgi:hypothetical protein
MYFGDALLRNPINGNAGAAPRRSTRSSRREVMNCAVLTY